VSGRLASALLLCAALTACRAANAPSTPAGVIVAFPSVPRSLVSYRSSDEFSASALRNAYEPLVDLGRDLSLVPCLAESWYSPDDLTWVFRLRRGVTFHDGRPLQAQQVAAVLREASADPASRRSFRDIVSRIEAPDDGTVVVHTYQPSGMLHSVLNVTYIGLDSGVPGRPPVGTGPYRVAEWKPGQRLALEAFEGHREGVPAIRRLEFRGVPDARERARLLRSGEADLAVDVPLEEMDALAGTPGLRVASRQGLRVVHLGMNVLAAGANPLRDRRVREAIATAIDRPALVSGPQRGRADLMEELIPPEVFGHVGTLPARAYDPPRARRLLAEAGYASGFRTTLDYIHGRHQAIDAVAEAIAAALGQVGVKVEPRPATLEQFRDRVSVRKETALFLMGWLSATGDAATTMGSLVRTPSGGGFGLYSTYSDAEVDRFLAEASGLLGRAQRKTALQEAATRVHDQVAVVPLYRQRDLYAFKERLDFDPRLDRRIRGQEIRWRP